MAKKNKDRNIITKVQNGAYLFSYDHFTAKDVENTIAHFIENNPLFKAEDAWMEIGYSHSYYDSIDIDVSIHAKRLETDEEYTKRLEKEEAKRIRDAESSKRNKAAAKLAKEIKDKEDYIRLTKKFTGEEIDPDSI